MYNKKPFLIFVLLFFVFVTSIILPYSVFGKVTVPITLESNKISLKFDAKNGAFISMYDKMRQVQLSDSKQSVSDSPWELYLKSGKKSYTLDIRDFKRFSYSSSPETLVLLWSQAKDGVDKSIIVKATVSLEGNSALSSWHISVTGIKDNLLSKVVFPKVSGLNSAKDEYLALPRWMGELLQDPKEALTSMKKGRQHFVWDYPGFLSMQFLALYNHQKGFYASCDDSEAYVKRFSISLDSLNTMIYQMENIPEADSASTGYDMTYQAIIGAFQGDWFTAAEIYREWGEQQNWAKNSRLKNGLTPEWLTNTALWVWNRGRSEQVLTPALGLKEKLNLPVSVLWHWWHAGSYDDSFPEYLPPREGKDSFTKNIKASQEKGIHSLVYMNQLQWGPSTLSWETENAAAYAVKDSKGKMNTQVYNTFTRKALINMCIATDFWRNKYASLADSVINTYGVNGIYMDQACISRMCYDASHGHPLGGGNYWVPNSGKLTGQIRGKVSNNREVVLSGEGSGEAWMPYLDVFLALQVSRERYAGVQGWEPIPLFQAVYHQYAISYGNYSSLLNPPYDEMWPEERKPANALKLLDPVFNTQFLMEQARSFVWGMQPMISNYQSLLTFERKEEIDFLLNMAKVRNNNLKYLLYGRYVRSPKMSIPKKEIKISKLSIYAGQKNKVKAFEKAYPTVYSSSWLAKDKTLGIALASIDDKSYMVDMEFRSEDYGLANSGKIYFTGVDGEIFLGTYSDGNIRLKHRIEPLEIGLIQVKPD